MGDQVNKRERGLWSMYTPASSPFHLEVKGKVYSLPSLKALTKFIEEVDGLEMFYKTGREMLTEDGTNLSYEEAVDYVYNKRYERWLKGKVQEKD